MAPGPEGGAWGGAILYTHERETDGGASGLLLASFIAPGPDAGGDASDDCTSDTVAGCVVRDCLPFGAGPHATRSAGSLKLTGGFLADAGVTVDPDDAGLYLATTSGGRPIVAGDVLTVTAPGATVPAFVASVAAPPDVELAPEMGVSVGVDRSTDFSVSWKAPAVGSLDLSLLTRSATRFTDVTCTTSASHGAATMPAAALARLDVADGRSVVGVLAASVRTGTALAPSSGDVALWMISTSSRPFVVLR